MNILEKWQLVFNEHLASPPPKQVLGYKLKLSK